eukprot:scaffold6785_cov76-Skeletonema_dohrnii-CCMP3373.AAC.1
MSHDIIGKDITPMDLYSRICDIDMEGGSDEDIWKLAKSWCLAAYVCNAEGNSQLSLNLQGITTASEQFTEWCSNLIDPRSPLNFIQHHSNINSN